MSELFYLNGQILPSEQAVLHISDLAFLRGYGIFDFFRAVNGKTIFIEDHLDRFENSARLMSLPIPESRERLREIIQELVRLNPSELLGIKLILTGGYSPDGYTPTTPNLVVIAKPFAFAPAKVGLKLMSLEHQRELPEVKTTNYAVPIFYLQKMKKAGADDFLYHRDGLITESSRSNIFIVKDEKLITPKRNTLHGITRKHIIQFAKNHFEVEERDVTIKEFREADEVFTTGSTKRIIPIAFVDNQPFSEGEIGKITQKLQSLFLEHELER